MDTNTVQNTAELRSLNKKKIIDALRMGGAMTKKDIVDAAQLSFSTVSSLCNQLELEGFLRYSDDSTSNGGRMPKILSLNPDGRCIVSVNLVREAEVRITLTNLVGKSLNEWICTDSELCGYDGILQAVDRGVAELLAESDLSIDRVLGVAIAIPGIHDRTTGLIVNSTVQSLNQHSLDSDLKKLLGVLPHVENESNLLALAALQSKDETPADNLLYIYIGEGLGAGIIENRKLLTGAHGYGSEIGHMPLGRRGYGCYCGESGCIETEVSIGGFVRKYNEVSAQPIAHTTTVVDQWKEFASRVKAGDECALSVVRENGKLLGTLLSVLINLLDPDDLYIGGYIEDIFDEIREDVLEEARKRLIVQRSEELTLHCTRGYNRLITAGCTELTMMRWRP